MEEKKHSINLRRDEMPDCICCGLPIPKGQKICSMCYGDPDYGSDGYYRQWQEEQRRKEEDAQASEEMED